MEETISRMAGAEWGIEMTPASFDDAIRAIGRVPAVAHHDVRPRRARPDASPSDEHASAAPIDHFGQPP